MTGQRRRGVSSPRSGTDSAAVDMPQMGDYRPNWRGRRTKEGCLVGSTLPISRKSKTISALRTPLFLGALAAAIGLSALLAGRAEGAPTAVWPECTPTHAVQCEGWFRGPVNVKWQHPSATGFEPGTCIWQTLQRDTPGTALQCNAWQGSPDSGTTRASVVVRIDATSPTVVTATPDRPPDYNGWFNHPVSLSFRGTDATSGVAVCSSEVYGGPDGAGVPVAGTCQDVAGNVGGGSSAINYDATPPPAPVVDSLPGNKSVVLEWSTSPDSQAEVVRVDRAAPPVVVYRGPGGTFKDRSLRNGRRYRYDVSLIDQAGNRAVGTTSTVPTSSKLLLPLRASRIPAVPPPQLIWKPVRKADYYNVQIFRGRDKVLSTWPRRPMRRLKRRWRFGGKQYRLVPGKYCWYVWPGKGRRAKRDYGKRLGKSCFRIVR
jgi:hypothetical protein